MLNDWSAFCNFFHFIYLNIFYIKFFKFAYHVCIKFTLKCISNCVVFKFTFSLSCCVLFVFSALRFGLLVFSSLRIFFLGVLLVSICFFYCARLLQIVQILISQICNWSTTWISLVKRSIKSFQMWKSNVIQKFAKCANSLKMQMIFKRFSLNLRSQVINFIPVEFSPVVHN